MGDKIKTMIEIKTPKPIIKNTKLSANAFSMLAATKKALSKSDLYSENEVNSIIKEMKSSDYDNVLQTMLKYCIVD